MAATPLKTLLFLGGATVAAVGVAYVSGALDPWLGSRVPAPVPQVASTPEPASPPTATAPAPEPAKPEQQAAIAPAQQQPAPAASAPEPQPVEEPAPQAEQAAPGAVEPLSPTFDVLRVEPDGSIVIAGRALPNSEVEVLSGSKVLAKVGTNADGDFVAVLDEPLNPGDYQIVLRATTPAGVVASSKETAIVSIPETADGQVLALVEEAGAPSRLITVPEPAAPASGEVAAPQTETPVSTTTPPADAAAAPAQAAPPTEPKTDRPESAVKVAVDAVEIDGRKIFVAGGSAPGNTVRIYANEILLGDAKVTPEGRFLLETERDLPVGDYVIRADVLGSDGAKVIARAAVPFSREAGETISAVAPHVPDPSEQPAPAGESAQAAAGEEPSKPAPDAPAQSEMLAPKLEAVDGSVIIRRGDSLWRISKRVYGRGIRYSTIYLANQEQIKDPDMIWPGQIFRVPEKTEEGEKADLEAIEAPAPATVQ